MPEPQVTVRSTEAGRVTEVVVPGELVGAHRLGELLSAQIPKAWIVVDPDPGYAAIRQPGGPDVVALAGERLRIAAGRVERVQ